MKPLKKQVNRKPETIIQEAIEDYLLLRGWHVMPTHGNECQRGFPDLYCIHPRYKQRWIEVKNPVKYAFTAAQLEHFPIVGAWSNGIWILTAATEYEYKKLFQPANWYMYLEAMK